jgi:GTP-binding protein
MKSWLQHFGLPYLVVSTKVDKLSANEKQKSRQTARKVLDTEEVIPYSSITREGASQVWDRVREKIRAGIAAT